MAGKKVLVVDDEIHIVHVVAIKLRNNGFEVISAGDGEEGLSPCWATPGRDLLQTGADMFTSVPRINMLLF